MTWTSSPEYVAYKAIEARVREPQAVRIARKLVIVIALAVLGR